MAALDSESSTLFEKIQDLILDEGYRDGDLLLSEAKLVQRFGCSRSSVREALKQLQTLGLVEIRRGIGTYVGPFSVKPLLSSIAFGAIVRSRSQPSAFLDLLEVRIALDLGMAQPMCEVYAGTKPGRLDEIVDSMVEAAHKGQSLMDLDREFHREMQSVLGNSFAVDLMNNFWTVFRLIGLDEQFQPSVSPVEIAESHRGLLVAARTGDVDEYTEAVLNHYRGSREQAYLFAQSGRVTAPVR